MKALLTIAAVAVPLIAIPALAQAASTTDQNPATTAQSPATTAPSTTTAAAAPSSTTTSDQVMWYTQSSGEMRASKLIGATVQNTAGESIGKINEVLFDSSGAMKAAVVGVGGFLGMGEHEVAITFNSLKLAHNSDGSTVVTVNATKDSLKAAPVWKWPSA